jgi:hypothetical protein
MTISKLHFPEGAWQSLFDRAMSILDELYATLNAGAYYPLSPEVNAYAQVRYYDSVKDIDSLSGSIGISGQF